MPDWWLDERAHAGADHLDAGYVSRYERKAGYDPAPDVEALARFGLNPSSTVVDLGCGTGVFAAAVAPRCRRVVAVDVSPAMAEVVRAKVTGTGAGNVDVVEAGSLSYEHAGDPPDFVFTRNALHQLPDFWKGVAPARIASLLPAGGILRLHDLVFDFEPADAETRIEAWCAQGSAQSPTERSPFRPIHPALPRDFRTLPGCYLLRFSDRIRRADGRKGRGNGSSSL